MNLVRARRVKKKIFSICYPRRKKMGLSFEALRYFDLMRWGIAGEKLAKQEGVNIKNRGVDTKMKAGEDIKLGLKPLEDFGLF